jgi:hypothetical protein
MLKRLVLGLLVLWAGAGLLSDLRSAVTTWDARDQWVRPQWSWRFGAPQVLRLERCTAAARRILPPGSVVAFAAPPDEPQGNAFFLQRWAAYLMPAHELVPVDDTSAPAAEYLITYAVRIQNPRLTLYRRLPGCRLYRVARVNP